MDIRRIDELARTSTDTNERLTIYERYYYVAIRGLYSQCKAREITSEQLEHDKEVIVDVHEEYIGKRMRGEHMVHLNKPKVVEAVILEIGRYISCGITNEQREKAYPRKLFENRIVEVINTAYGY